MIILSYAILVFMNSTNITLETKRPSFLFIIFLHILFFFYLYNISFIAFPLGTTYIVSIIIFPIFLLSLLKKYHAKRFINLKIEPNFLNFYLMILYLICVSLLYSVFLPYIQKNLHVPISLARIIFIIVPIAYIFSSVWFNQFKLTLEHLISIFINCVIIQSIFCWISKLFFPFYNLFISQILNFHINYDILNPYTTQSVGFSSVLSTSYSIIHAFAIILCINKTFSHSKLSILYLIKALFIAITLIIIARTGLMYLIAHIGIHFIYTILYKPNTGLKLLFFLIVLGICVAFLATIFFPHVFTSNEFLWATSFFTNGLQENSTLDLLSNHLHLPTSLLSLLFGTGSYFSHSIQYFTTRSDSGLINLIWTFGLLHTIMFYFSYFSLILNTFRRFKSHPYITPFISFSFACLILDIKAPLLFKMSILVLFFTFLISFFMDKKKT